MHGVELRCVQNEGEPERRAHRRLPQSRDGASLSANVANARQPASLRKRSKRFPSSR